MVCVDSLVIALSKMKDLCICMWLWTKTWQKCTATVLCWAVWVDWGSTAVSLASLFSLFFWLLLFSSVTLVQWGDQQRRLILLHSPTYISSATYTGSCAWFQFKCSKGQWDMPDRATTEQSSLASKKVWEYNIKTGSVEEIQKVKVLFLAQVKWTSFSVRATRR